jgi:hypothetical protein
VDIFEVAQHYLKSTIPSTLPDRIKAAKVVLKVALDCVNCLKALETAHVYCARAVELLGKEREGKGDEDEEVLRRREKRERRGEWRVERG